MSVQQVTRRTGAVAGTVVHSINEHDRQTLVPLEKRTTNPLLSDPKATTGPRGVDLGLPQPVKIVGITINIVMASCFPCNGRARQGISEVLGRRSNIVSYLHKTKLAVQ